MIPTTKSTLAALPRAARFALQWRLLLLWAGCLLVPTLILALPMWQMLGANLDHSVHSATLAQQLDMTAIADLMASRGSAALPNAGIAALAVTLLLSPLLSGMVVSAARAPGPLGFRGLAGGALHEYPRMLRMLMWAVVPLALAAAAGSLALDLAQKYAATAILESDAQLATMSAVLVLGLLLVLADATLDAGRAALALDRRRRSAIAAWWDGCKLLARRPLATVGVYLAISAAGLLFAAPLAMARIKLAHIGVSAGGFIAVLALTQLIVLALAWMRGARLFALVELARSSRT
jgi:hypothetical protein